MRKFILILCAGYLSIFSSHALPYVSLADCGNDTLLYIEKNYEDNMTSYIGKTIGYWIDQCELNLTQYLYIPVAYYASYLENKNLEGKIKLVRIDVTYTDGPDFVYTIYLYIDESTLIDYQSAINISADYDEALMPKYYSFYKNAKIKRISIYKKINGKPVENYRRPDNTAPFIIEDPV